MLDLIKRAGLTRKEAATIVGVSTVALWKHENGGGARPNILLRLTALRTMLERLIEAGKLPKHNIAFAPRISLETRAKRAMLVAKLRAALDEKVRTTPNT